MKRGILRTGVCFLLMTVTTAAQPPGAIDPEAVIERILAVEAEDRAQIKDVTYDAEFIERDQRGTEKARILKKIYVKYLPDTTLYYEEYLQYYSDGQLQSDQERDGEAAARREKAIKRKAKNVSYRLLTPFLPQNRAHYEISYQGVTREKIEGYVCHHFKAHAKEEKEDYIDGDFFFEAGSFHLVRADISPARLVKTLMFRLNELRISTILGPTARGVWLPREVDVRGKGRAALFIGVSIASTEYYRNPAINSGIAQKIFQGDRHE